MSNSSNNYSDYMGKEKQTEKSHPPSEVYPHNRSNSSIDYIIFPSTGQAKEVQKVKASEGSFATNFKQYAPPVHEYICFTECEQRPPPRILTHSLACSSMSAASFAQDDDKKEDTEAAEDPEKQEPEK
jgi:hypothetical protein